MDQFVTTVAKPPRATGPAAAAAASAGAARAEPRLRQATISDLPAVVDLQDSDNLRIAYGHNDAQSILEILDVLSRKRIGVATMKELGIGKLLTKLQHHSNADVARSATAIVELWTATITKPPEPPLPKIAVKCGGDDELLRRKGRNMLASVLHSDPTDIPKQWNFENPSETELLALNVEEALFKYLRPPTDSLAAQRRRLGDDYRKLLRRVIAKISTDGPFRRAVLSAPDATRFLADWVQAVAMR